ncbi:MAG: sensor histidine kinase [Planctomycetaceae bacterium]|jgi:signal transduction histidine kinase|nr:sensor histidine kinase [Planctomycetaceae bacterium]
MSVEQPSVNIAELTEHIRVLEERLEQTQRLTALGELVGTTTHEFNNILMTILNYAKMGLRHQDDETRQKAFEKILAAAERASKVTSTILGVARNRKPSLEPTDLASLVDDALLLLEREMTKYRVRVEKVFVPVPEIIADGNRIQQVLVNLFINARQAMPDGGRLVVKIVPSSQNGMVELTVRDFGCGIPKDKLSRIFDLYFSTKSGPDASGKGGSGLGLALCKKVIEEHHGRIRVESAIGKGTAFTLTFPAAESETAQAG